MYGQSDRRSDGQADSRSDGSKALREFIEL